MHQQGSKPALHSLYWGLECLVALFIIVAGPIEVIVTSVQLIQDPTWGTALWTTFWVVFSLVVVPAGLKRWRNVTARRTQ